MGTGRTIRYKGRYINDNLLIQHEPAGVYEDPCGEGIAELRVEPLSVITITPRPVPRKRTRNHIRKAVVLASAILMPIAFVALADVLVVNTRVFFGSFAACIGWPAFVYWANIRD